MPAGIPVRERFRACLAALVADRRLAGRVVLAVMGLAWVTLASASLRQTSITVDEFGHLPAGYNLLTTGDFRYCSLNPPVLNALSAAPLLFMDLPGRGSVGPLGRDASHDFWRNGYAFMDRHRGEYLAAFNVARHVTVAIVALLGVLVFAWARRLVPERPNLAGLLAAALVWLTPDVLAHARLVTTDAGSALSIALTIFAGWALVRSPGFARAALCGLALGVAMLCKFSAVSLYLVLPIQAALLLRGRPEARGPVFKGLAIALGVSLAVINAGYLLEGTGERLDAGPWRSGVMQGAASLLPGATPVPVPASFARAFDQQLADSRSGDPSYLLGERYHGGRWDYFLILLVTKTPVPLLLLAAWGTLLALRQRDGRGRDAVLLLLPGAICLGMFSLLSEKQLGLRQILPGVALFWLWAACALSRQRLDLPRAAVLAGLLAWAGVVIVQQYPGYLSTFNLLAGGSQRGHEVAVDSNLDWGQDLVQLKRYLDSHPTGPIRLLYFGRVDPSLYGIDYVVGDPVEEPELTAVSLSLHGRPYVAYDHGELRGVGPVPWSDPRLGEPIARVGSIRIFRTASALRPTALALP
ncbi:MAG: glycosyltransferase family 39 protein [Deltaproteobacteria bacterium]|nr:glycosyltransferase family 39 protein [Deltaproteobacteria bacterium]